MGPQVILTLWTILSLTFEYRKWSTNAITPRLSPFESIISRDEYQVIDVLKIRLFESTSTIKII